MNYRRGFNTAPSLIRIARIREVLKHPPQGKGPMTAKQLAPVIHSSESTAGRFLKHMHEELRMLRISGWDQRARGKFIPIFSSWPGPDAPKPDARTNAEHSREYRKRILADAEKREQYREKRRAEWHRRKLRKNLAANPMPMAQFAQNGDK